MVPDGLRRASEWSWRLLLVAAAVVAVGWALSQVFLVVVVVIAAMLLTTLFNPLADRLRRAGWRSGYATAASMVSGLAIIGLLAWLLAPPVVNEFGQVGSEAANGVRQAQHWLIHGPLHLSHKQVNNIANTIVRQLQGKGGSAVHGVLNGVLTVGETVTAVLLTIVLTVFFVRDGARIWGWLVGLWPPYSQPRMRQVGEVAWSTMGGYIRGIATIGLIDALLIGLGMLILGVPLVLPLMFLTFAAAFVPLVGSTLAGVVCALVALVSKGLVAALVLVGIIVGVQQFEGHVAYPVIMRRAVRVHPVAILIAVPTGALVAGIFGAIVAVPAVAICARVLEIVRTDHADHVPEPPIGDRGVVLDPADGRPAEEPERFALETPAQPAQEGHAAP